MGSSVSQTLPKRIQTVPEMLAWWNQQIPDADALYHKDKGWWEPLTWREYQERSDSIAAGLISIGITSGDHIAILSQTKLEWILADIAIMSCGAVTVPIYQSNTAEQCEYIIGHSECSAIFLEDQEQLDKLRSEEHTSELQSRTNLVCRLLLEKKKTTKKKKKTIIPEYQTGAVKRYIH